MEEYPIAHIAIKAVAKKNNFKAYTKIKANNPSRTLKTDFKNFTDFTSCLYKATPIHSASTHTAPETSYRALPLAFA